MNDLLRIFITGWVVLIVAVLANIIAVRFGITTWYPFIEDVGKAGILKAFSDTSFVSKLFLFIIYPLLLGFSAFLIFKNLK